MKLKPLDEQVVVITGASSGIGRATALLAAERGAAIVLAARGTAALEALAGQIEQAGGRALAVTCDVSDHAAVEELAARAVAAFGRIDCWVNNAGVAIAARLETLPDQDARRLFDVNFWGVVHGSRAALPHLSGEGGALINMGSFTSDVAAPFMGMYSASKQAVKGYTDALRIEVMMDRRPVSVTLIKPAPVATPVLEHQLNLLERQATMPPPFYDPRDVAETILYAAEHPVRDLFVGGAARFGSIFAQVLPGVADFGAALLGRRLFTTRHRRQERPDNLRMSAPPAAIDGDTHGRLAHRSVYSAMRLRPRHIANAAMLLATVGGYIMARPGAARGAGRRT